MYEYSIFDSVFSSLDRIELPTLPIAQFIWYHTNNVVELYLAMAQMLSGILALNDLKSEIFSISHG